MTNSNDDRILKLKEQVENKKKEIKKIKKFSPLTNCSMELDGVRYNINVLPKQQLLDVLMKLQILLTASKELEIVYSFSGYTVNEWFIDVKSKYDYFNVKEEEGKLKAMESKLHQLLSTDKQTELELDKIAKEMGL